MQQKGFSNCRKGDMILLQKIKKGDVRMKKMIAVIALVATLTLGMKTSVEAASKFYDVNNTKYEASVEKLTNLDIINGFPDGSFKPGESVTRAQLAKMIVKGLKLKKLNNIALTNFSDVTPSHWAYDSIKIAVDNKIILGYPDGTFKPEDQVSYAETMTMLLRAMKLEDKMTDKSWPNGYMNEANKVGLLKSVDYKKPDNKATRGETAVSIYNMMNKIEDDELQAQIEKQKEQEAAAKNAFSYGIVSTVTEKNSAYTIKLSGNKTKYSLASLEGTTKLTSSKTKGLSGSIVAYKDDGKEMDIENHYTASNLDKAKIISKVSGSTVTFTDKTTLDTANTTNKNKYALYTFVAVTAEYDEEDGTIEFTKVEKLGLGLDKVKFAKSQRLVIDDSNKTILVVKGFSNSDTIKKGKVTDFEYDTSDYKYGMVSGFSSKRQTVKLDKTLYDVYSKSKDFTNETLAVYTIDDDGLVTLVKAYGVSALDGSTKIVQSVSGSKAGSQKVTYKGSSSAVDYYTTANTDKYEDYYVLEVEVYADKKTNEVYIDSTEKQDSLEDVKFYKGDRVLIDEKTKVFIIFSGLEASDTVKNGVKQTTTTPSGDTKPATTKGVKLSSGSLLLYETSDGGKTTKTLRTFKPSEIKVKNSVTSVTTDSIVFSSTVGLGTVKKNSTAYACALVSAEVGGDNTITFDKILSSASDLTLAKIAAQKDDLVIYDSTNKAILFVRMPSGYSVKDLNDDGTVKPEITRDFYLVNSLKDSQTINLTDMSGKAVSMTLVNDSVLPSDFEDKEFCDEVPTFVYIEKNSDGLASNIQEVSNGKTFESFKVSKYTSSTNISKATILLVQPKYEGANITSLTVKTGTGTSMLSDIKEAFAITEGSTVKYVLAYKVVKPEKAGLHAGLVANVSGSTVTIDEDQLTIDTGKAVAGNIILYKELVDDTIKIVKSYTLADIQKGEKVSKVNDSLVSFNDVDYTDLTEKYADYTLIEVQITEGDSAKINSASMKGLVSKGITVQKDNYILVDSSNKILIVASK